MEKGLWATNKKLGDTVCTIAALESRVEKSETALLDVKKVVQDEIRSQVGKAVTSQLVEMGFDPNLTAADLIVRSQLSTGRTEATDRSSQSIGMAEAEAPR